MEKTATPPKAFSLKSQYVPVIQQAAQDAGVVAPEDDDDEASEPAGKKRPKKRKLDGENGVKVKPVWDYNTHRKAFIKNAMSDENVSYAKAQEMWNDMDEKCKLLGTVSVSELKKRRFISRQCFENPWAAKLNPK